MNKNIKINFANCTDSDHTEVDNTNRHTTTTNYTEQIGDFYNPEIPSSAHPNYTNQPNYYYFGQQGWICPRCGRVNAPFMSQCTCNGSDYPNPDVPKITWTCNNK